MKTATITTSFTVSALAFTSVLTTSAVTYNAVCIFDELKCGGAIQLREFTPSATNKCDSGDCAAITATGVSTFSALPTCTDNHLTDTAKHLRGKPYVIVETYAGTGCTGDFTKAVAVVASGKCFPSATVDMSYQVTIGEKDLSVTWMQYACGDCSSNATTLSFMASEVGRTTCVKNTMKVLAVKSSTLKSSAVSTVVTTLAAGMLTAVAAMVLV